PALRLGRAVRVDDHLEMERQVRPLRQTQRADVESPDCSANRIDVEPADGALQEGGGLHLPDDGVDQAHGPGGHLRRTEYLVIANDPADSDSLQVRRARDWISCCLDPEALAALAEQMECNDAVLHRADLIGSAMGSGRQGTSDGLTSTGPGRPE